MDSSRTTINDYTSTTFHPYSTPFIVVDIDSDGDGILDTNEFVAPGVDATTCCIPMAGKTTSPIDSNNNGVPDFLDAKDSDNDGL